MKRDESFSNQKGEREANAVANDARYDPGKGKKGGGGSLEFLGFRKKTAGKGGRIEEALTLSTTKRKISVENYETTWDGEGEKGYRRKSRRIKEGGLERRPV